MPSQIEDPIVIVGMARTPMGGLLGELSGFSAHELGAVAIRAALADAKIDAEAIDQVIMGNVLSAGQGQAPARQFGATHKSLAQPGRREWCSWHALRTTWWPALKSRA